MRCHTWFATLSGVSSFVSLRQWTLVEWLPEMEMASNYRHAVDHLSGEARQTASQSGCGTRYLLLCGCIENKVFNDLKDDHVADLIDVVLWKMLV